MDTQSLIAKELGDHNDQAYQAIENSLHERGRVLAGLIRSIEAGTNA